MPHSLLRPGAHDREDRGACPAAAMMTSLAEHERCVRLKPAKFPGSLGHLPSRWHSRCQEVRELPGAKLSIESAVSVFGLEAKAKLSAIAAKGEPEDQLRNPREQLVAAMTELCGQARSKLTLIGESSLSELHTRPDFAVSYANALIGFIEVKAPGKGADPRKFKDPHDKAQWKKLAALPNLIYTDGNSFTLWRDGNRVGEVQRLDGGYRDLGGRSEAVARSTCAIRRFPQVVADPCHRHRVPPPPPAPAVREAARRASVPQVRRGRGL